MEVLQIAIVAIIVVTMGGRVCDWVFSGMVNPILDEEPIDPEQKKMEEDLARFRERKKQEGVDFSGLKLHQSAPMPIYPK